MMKEKTIPLSLLDLAPITEGNTLSDAITNSVRLAQAAEKAGYHRFWMAEHHNMVDIASAATAVILSHIGAKTEKIRIGSGGIMLPNHAPLVVAEQFGTLEIMYPGRVDLGLGRAPGTDQETLQALRRETRAKGLDFPDMLDELQHFLAPAQRGQRITAVPGAGLDIPLWLLGSSTFSAQLAAQKGLPLVFASHFAPDAMLAAIDTYRSGFRPSESLAEPYVMICVNVVAAESQSEADYLATTELQKFVNLGRGVEVKLPKPVDDMNALWHPVEAQRVLTQLRESVWGTKETVRTGLNDLVRRTGADEIMVNSWIHDADARIRSHQLIAEAWN
ncbi:LLM class flavin-dependent oxidoreductase [Chimaeribacter arupi]|uniref:Luciferase-like monooxygenase n=2 Tax=Chimaeribacter arupi TaxID=2060066 RepID=A0A2N5EKS8_9GAMM|nr:LLM class flavin-dependent oxidoreductase [Chimaeribacter arupi]PLR44137.1 LLM class flavin-dependent oxidoreductase [Chimaeribacter arupi]PLR47349.1 LLM class flavin-dependent oxidoreductase [Chimaeribacter arupi]